MIATEQAQWIRILISEGGCHTVSEKINMNQDYNILLGGYRLIVPLKTKKTNEKNNEMHPTKYKGEESNCMIYFSNATGEYRVLLTIHNKSNALSNNDFYMRTMQPIQYLVVI
ncbi:hypothetical protein ACJX0J_032903, partial [Zea mays]